jgi:hypothetical protein
MMWWPTNDMKAHQQPIGKNDEWITPESIIRSLGHFDLDPCAPANPRQVLPWADCVSHFVTLPGNGLTCPWTGRIWLNPPFNRNERPKWMARMAEHGNGVMLIPAATETEAFDKQVWKRATGILFLKGRPHFHYVDGRRAPFNCGTAICLVAYGDSNADRLMESQLGRFFYI